MKLNHLLLGLLSIITASCTIEEALSPDLAKRTVPGDEILHAAIDEESTKTFIDTDLNILWNADDRIKVFNNNTYGIEYKFLGKNGDPSGDFKKIVVEEEEDDDDIISGGTDLGGAIFAVYPHSKDTKIVQNGTITYTFPDVQTYHENSFGRGANVMVAEASVENKYLSFKNAMGYLSFKLWGDNVHVSSVILEANGEEALAGKGTIKMVDGAPSVSIDGSTASNSIRLYCDDVLLGSSADEYTEFWFALPPVVFTQANGGFTITVTTTDGGVFTRDAAMDLTIKRKTVERMKPLKVVPTYDTANNMTITSLSSTRNGVTYNAEGANGIFTLTIPTVTDFTNLIINYTLAKSTDILMVGGKKVVSGVTPIDASQEETSLVVCRGDIEKTYKLKAQNTGLPVVRIKTDGFTQADIEAVADHEGWWPKDKQPDGAASIRIEKADGTLDCESSLNIKGRGNATWKYDKRPFALKLGAKSEVLGMPSHDRWILLANWKDRTLIRNAAVFKLSEIAEMPYTVRGQFVELEFNGEHKGNYYLCEQIKIDPNRLAITKLKKTATDVTGGFLMEIDNNFDEMKKFKSGTFQLKYMFKEPEGESEDDVTYQAAWDYMTDYINSFEEEVKKTSSSYHGYQNYLDMDSAIKFMLINEMASNSDFFNTDYPGATGQYYGPHSTYLYKDIDSSPNGGGKLHFGPVWDFDYGVFVPASTPNSYKWKGFDNKNYYYYYLIKDPAFKERLKELFSEDMVEKYLTVANYIDDVADNIRLSEKFNYEIWGFNNYQQDQGQNGEIGLTFDEAVTKIKKGFTEKVNWMKNKIDAL